MWFLRSLLCDSELPRDDACPQTLGKQRERLELAAGELGYLGRSVRPWRAATSRAGGVGDAENTGDLPPLPKRNGGHDDRQTPAAA